MSGYYVKLKPYVDDYGIHVPDQEYVSKDTPGTYRCIMTKEVFVEAFNKWIVGEKKPVKYEWDDCEWMNDD